MHFLVIIWKLDRQTCIRDDLNLYLFHMWMEIHKIVKITTIRFDKVIIALADPSSSEVDDQSDSVKMCGSSVVWMWAAPVL